MESLFDLSGKVAVVTGSTKGIGRAIAEQLALHGAEVVVSSRKADACEEVAGEINASLDGKGGRAVAIPCHIGHQEQLESLVNETRSQLGKIDILVCNAAVNPFYGSMLDIPDSAYDKILDSNVKSNHWVCQLVLPEMVERKDGVILIVSSVGGLHGSAVLGTYGISKAADMALVRNISTEFGEHNIRANAIAPGLVRTDFARALWEDPETLKAATANAALRRIGEPEEIGGVAVFLSSRAGSFMTGQTVVVDGGRY
ncbi:MAG: SDR family oxidoreductase [Gammaproteobacteria bacterium]|jgi:NAD(P)-dependent dehydrogenase (short-subunit alcohol dehydrogenase family)|nr:SDR family oxidoreductase [Gammaproteobacteria bacterium]MBT4491688.1 SDR family oxidoreductase [Gammaproteobacteria bacterium]MBT7369074.1 SDR family oxidoreductase [Gammaproteobacteria bacterium]